MLENCLNKLRIKRREVFKGGINCVLIIDLFVFFPPRTMVVAEKFNQYVSSRSRSTLEIGNHFIIDRYLETSQ